VLEVGARLHAAGRLDERDDLFEADPGEIDALLRGGGPTAAALVDRRRERLLAATVSPPGQLGAPEGAAETVELPPSVARLAAWQQRVWSIDGGPPNADTGGAHRVQGIGIGTGIVRGRACVLDGPGAADRLDVGDILVAAATTSSHNAMFPIAAAVATQEGGRFSHAAILAREFGLPAVVGAAGLLALIRDGDEIELDPVAGTVTVLGRA